MIKKAMLDYKNGTITLDQLTDIIKSNGASYYIDSDGRVRVIIDVVFRKTRKEKLNQLLNNL